MSTNQPRAVGLLTLYADEGSAPARAGDLACVRAYDGNAWHRVTLLLVPDKALVAPGEAAVVWVEFDSADAAGELPAGKPLYFGDGIETRGLLVLQHYLDVGGHPVAPGTSSERYSFFSRTAPQAIGTLTIDSIESDGRPGRPFVLNDRPLARAEECWFGFVVVDMDTEVLAVGASAEVSIAFFDEAGAMIAFPTGSTFRFGNGTTTRGSVTLHWFCDDRKA